MCANASLTPSQNGQGCDQARKVWQRGTARLTGITVTSVVIEPVFALTDPEGVIMFFSNR